MPCCGINLDYWRNRLEDAEVKKTGVAYQRACDLLFPEGTAEDTGTQEYTDGEKGE